MVRTNSRSRSRSRSKTRSPRERVDRFGRVIPSSRKSRSRSRSNSRNRHGPRRRSRSRSPHRRFRRSRSRSRSDSRSRGHSSSKYSRREEPRLIKNRTNIEDPAFLNARLFIGNLPSSKVTKDELEALFNVYGKILGVSIHDRGFGFVQFEKEEDAQKAKEGENGTKLKGSVLDVKMAAEGRRGGGGGGRGRPREFERDSTPGGRGPAPPGGGPMRDRSPARGDPYEDRYRDPYRREPPPAGREERSGPPAARDDPYFRDDPYRRPPPPPLHDDPYRDTFREDPYRRDAPPYRRDPYEDPYRDPYFRDPYYPPPPKKPVPADVQIICMNKQLMSYADAIEGRLRQHALITDVVSIPEDMTVPQMVEESARLKFLFAITINSQNEAHKSLTLNILHGIPQEHRNMPMEDATKLVASSFEKYIEAQREKTAAPAAPATATPSASSATPKPAAAGATPFVPPSTDISYLLNLLADNRQLTIEEIDKVLEYLQERKTKLMVSEGRKSESKTPTGVPAPGAGDPMSTLHQQQQEIQSKILNILNGSSSSTSSTLSAATQAVQAAQSYGAGLGAQGARQAGGANNPLINLDNPNVQKALDNLIQSGPNLLKSIPSSVGQQQAPPRNQFAGQGQPGVPRYSGQQQSQAAAQVGAQSGYGQYYGQQQPQTLQGQGALRAGGYGQQPNRPLMSVRAPQQGIRPRY